MTTTNRECSIEQAAYLVTKAHAEECQTVARAILGPVPETDEEIDAYCERETLVHTELGTLRAQLALRDAEKALLAWGLAQARKDNGHTPEREQLLQRLTTTTIASYRQRAIDIIMRMKATPVKEGSRS